jgi:hypothetical protein
MTTDAYYAAVERVAKAMQSRGGYDVESWDALDSTGRNRWIQRAEHAIAAMHWSIDYQSDLCEDCGQPEPIWHANNGDWNRVMGNEVGFLCPMCFIARYEGTTGERPVWKLVRDETSPNFVDNSRFDPVVMGRA